MKVIFLNKVIRCQQPVAITVSVLCRIASSHFLCCRCVEVMFLLVRFKARLISKPRRLASRQVLKICNLILNSQRQQLVGHTSAQWKKRRINMGMWWLQHPTNMGTETIRGGLSFDFPLNCPYVVPGDL